MADQATYMIGRIEEMKAAEFRYIQSLENEIEELEHRLLSAEQDIISKYHYPDKQAYLGELLTWKLNGGEKPVISGQAEAVERLRDYWKCSQAESDYGC